MKKISIFLGGTQKSGTRSLSHYFKNHPNISIQKTKEGHFFDKSCNFLENHLPIPEKIKNYHDSFAVKQKAQLLCDITPDYIFRKNSVKRIFNYNPTAKWIILLRNPIHRAYSAWNMEVARNTEDLSFYKALQMEINNKLEGERSHDRFRYIGRSLYHSQLLRLWNYFPLSSCLIFSSETFWEDPCDRLKQIFDFIGIVYNPDIIYRHIHKGEYKEEIPPNTLKILNDILYFELNKLPKILGWDENPWSI